MKQLLTLTLLILLGDLYSQTGWDTGTVNFNYGSPFPSEAVEYSGSLLASDLLNQGVGGFEFSQGDTNFLSVVAYDIHVVDADTLADIFAIIIQDTVEIESGFHIVGFGEGSNKLFIWMEDVDPAMITALIDTSFSLDSLDVLNPYLSLSGQIEITEISESAISGNFAGAMINTSMELIMIGDGLFSASNSLPELTYDRGSLAIMSDTSLSEIEGELNPIQNNQGVGAIETFQGDTLTTTLLAYEINETDEGVSIYGITFRDLTDNYPGVGEQAAFNIGNLPDQLPMALPFIIEDASLEQVSMILTADGLPNMEDFENLFLAVSPGVAVFGHSDDVSAFATIAGLLMSNSSGVTQTIMESWTLNHASPSTIQETLWEMPTEKSIVGQVFPNPFNSSTIIPLSIPDVASLELVLYNILGQKVLTLPMGSYNAGRHNYQLNLGGKKLSAGLYYFRIHTANNTLGTGSIMYLK